MGMSQHPVAHDQQLTAISIICTCSQNPLIAHVATPETTTGPYGDGQSVSVQWDEQTIDFLKAHFAEHHSEIGMG